MPPHPQSETQTRSGLEPLRKILTFVRFSHTIFAMPFALGAMLVAARGLPALKVVFWIVLAMVFARTAAMAFNRYVDWEFDKRNPRTAGRHKLISKAGALGLVVISSIAFVAVTYAINPLCFALSPLALFLVGFYSFTKRFTPFAQLFLGLALSAAPVGAWLAVRGVWEWPPIFLAGAVLFWVAGFDIIYATQDLEADRNEGLHSMVTWLGIPRALLAARVFHTITIVGLALFGSAATLGVSYGVALLGMTGVLVYEHLQARRLDDLAAINRAFFLSNALVGALFLGGVALGIAY